MWKKTNKGIIKRRKTTSVVWDKTVLQYGLIYVCADRMTHLMKIMIRAQILAKLTM